MGSVQISFAVDAQDPAPIAPRARGAVYTPPALAEWVAERLVSALRGGPATVADLACGQGALLRAVASRRRGIRLVGIDIAREDLRVASQVVPNAHLIEADATGLRNVDAVGPFDGIILNPPWGVTLPHSARALRAQGYTLAEGQFDSANVFVELALTLLRPGGVAAFILPDSIFFPEHARVRQLLLASTELLLIARLGEGFFRDVFRGTAVVVARKAVPSDDHVVECLHLSAEERRAVLDGRRSLSGVAAACGHSVPQERFARYADFDISVRDEHAQFVEKLRRQGGTWSDWFESGRGVELSKSGQIVRCLSCRHAWPLPRTARALDCPVCGTRAKSKDLPIEVLTRPLSEAQDGWVPLIAGIDVGRYRCEATHAIRTGAAGINYKSEAVHVGERILVRKTGVGLRVALTAQSAYTTQVVFHYVPSPRAPRFLAAYVQGVMASRVMLAYHMLVSGETEWRSHPYVTQKVISQLPIPDPVVERCRRPQAKAIASAVRRHLAAPSGATDLAIEALVAGLFDLGQGDLKAVASVLDRAQDLSGFRELRFDPAAIRPQLVT
jgi:adenine-specific DNA-methyltransferase